MTGLFGADLFGAPVKHGGTLAQRHTCPPFSVINAAQQLWAERKRAWLTYGIKSEIGRAEGLLSNSALYSQGGNAQYSEDGEIVGDEAGSTSIFDPALAETLLAWFSVPGDKVIDPFAGGSVRGIVSSLLGRLYWGADIRQEQVEANVANAATICQPHLQPQWRCGDGTVRATLAEAHPADMVLTCPPYFDLEQYSTDPRDLSNMPYLQFKEAMQAAAHACYVNSASARFAAVVIGEARDRDGILRGLVPDVCVAWREAGWRYYNEVIYQTPVGTLRLRINSQWAAGRKIGRMHQTVLVFVKGNPEQATARLEAAVAGEDT